MKRIAIFLGSLLLTAAAQAGTVNASRSGNTVTGTVTSVTCGTGLTGGAITASGTCAVDTAVVPNVGDPQFFQPTTGQTISPTATGYFISCFVNPSGTISALTITLPTGTFKGQRISATFTQIVTTLTITGTNVGALGLASPTTAAVTSSFAWAWDSASTKWNRVQ